MKILVIGSAGLVGSRYVELYKTVHDLITPSINELDITNKQAVYDYLNKNRPDAIINFAAYTNVSEAETQRNDMKGVCWKVNVEGVENILSTINGSNTYFIQISTDMVFNGSQIDPGPYDEDHKPEFNSEYVTWYGYTKGMGELKMREKGGVLRLIYPVRARFDPKLDYLRKILCLYNESKLYPLFADQQISITYIDEACMALDSMLKLKAFGIFHASSKNCTTPYDIAIYLIRKLNKDYSVVQKGSIVNVENKVRYPRFGGLMVEKTQKFLNIQFNNWEAIVDKLVEQGIEC
jgi:dTDP-4-dehydrorhamnose reductase